MDCYDFVVIGAGPIGLYTATKLTSISTNSAIIEAKTIIDHNNLCSGLVSAQFPKKFNIPVDLIIDQYEAIKVNFSRFGSLTLKTDCIRLDRILLKKFLLERLFENGCTVIERTKVTNLIVNNTHVEIKTDRPDLKVGAECVIIAVGPNIPFVKMLTDVEQIMDVWGYQTTALGKIAPKIEVNIRPENKMFSWKISDSQSKILTGYLTSISSNEASVGKYMPFFRPKEIAKKRFVLIGACSGQVKSTTGGGLFYGFLGSEILARCLEDNDNIARALKEYNKEITSQLSKEFDFGIRLWRLLLNCEPVFVRKMMEAVINFDLLADDITIDFDWHYESVSKLFSKLRAFNNGQ